jgi:hypothetical protein
VILKEVLAVLDRAPLGHVHALDLDADAARRSITGADALRPEAVRRGAVRILERVLIFWFGGIAHGLLIITWQHT